MTTAPVYIVRHGEPADTSIFYGQLDVPLSNRGLRQVELQVESLRDARVKKIISSDLERTRVGAQALADAFDVELEFVPALREMHLGVLEGLVMRDALRVHPELAGRSYEAMLDFGMPGGGESVRVVAERAMPVIESAIAERVAQSDGALVVYAHNTVVRLVLAHAAGLGPAGYVRFKQTYGAITRIDVRSGAGASVWDRSCIVWSNRAVDTGEAPTSRSPQ